MLSADPVDFSGGGVDYFGRYHYANNNPANLTDPTGAVFGDPRDCDNDPNCKSMGGGGAATRSGGSNGVGNKASSSTSPAASITGAVNVEGKITRSIGTGMVEIVFVDSSLVSVTTLVNAQDSNPTVRPADCADYVTAVAKDLQPQGFKQLNAATQTSADVMNWASRNGMEIDMGQAQSWANDGFFVIAGSAEARHVVLIRPGTETWSGNWKQNVPSMIQQKLDGSEAEQYSGAKISRGFSKDDRSTVKYYVVPYSQ